MGILDYSKDVSEWICHRGDFDLISNLLNLAMTLCA